METTEEKLDHATGWVLVGVDTEGKHCAEQSLHLHIHPAEWPAGHYVCVGLPLDLCVGLLADDPTREYRMTYHTHDDDPTAFTIDIEDVEVPAR